VGLDEVRDGSVLAAASGKTRASEVRILFLEMASPYFSNLVLISAREYPFRTLCAQEECLLLSAPRSP